jgi:hypothetical protein
VRQAIAEFDRLGQDAFLSTYGFRKARDYFLIHNGQPYDSKAIAGVAHQYLPGRVALKFDEFSGSELMSAFGLKQTKVDFDPGMACPLMTRSGLCEFCPFGWISA